MTNEQPIMPAFVFDRRHHIELEAGFILAGQLIVDIRKKKLSGFDQRKVENIIQRLTTEAQSGRMPTDAFVIGWHGEAKPPNAVDTDNDEIMAAWAARSVSIVVRIDPRKGGLMRIDSDAARQMRRPKHDA